MTLKALPTKPTFCVIAPTEYLTYTTATYTHLVLAHIVDTNEKYAAHYKRLSDMNDFIIMDNGAFELGESFEPSKLIELGKKCGADAIVLPDYPFKKGEVTIKAAEKWIPMIKEAGFRCMFVPQSETDDLQDWIHTYRWASRNPDIDIIGMSVLAIPNALPHIPAAYARVVMTTILKERNGFSAKYHHYLGLNAGPALEIPPLLKMGALDSCDSSNPVWMAILGHEYSRTTDSLLGVKKIHVPVDFKYPFSRDMAVHRRIQHNIDLTMELFDGN